MTYPVTTTITNTTNSDKLLHWTSKGTIWVGANSSVTIPYEPCSVADAKQLRSIIAACSDGVVQLSINLLQADGSYVTVNYAPAAADKQPISVAKPATEPVKTFVENMEEDEQKHIIEAKGTGMAQIAERVGVTMEKVEPPTAEPVEENSETMVSVEGASTEGFQKDDSAPAVAEGVESVMTGVDPTSIEEEFNKLIEQKDWQGALELLIERFGKDKITFTSRTIMSIKDLNKIREKYGF